MITYSDTFKEALIQKLLPPNPISASALSRKTGISQPTLSRWLRECNSKIKVGDTMNQKRPQDWTVQEQLTAVLTYESLKEDEKGRFLREKGLFVSHIEEWKALMISGLKRKKLSEKKGFSTAERKRIKDLEKELRRKDKALAETAALLVLKKKAEAYWESIKEKK